VTATIQQTLPDIRRRPRLAVFKFASCDGCQLSLLDCEDELLAIADAIEIAYFLEATSRVEPGPYDISLVEGSVATSHDAARIREVRRQSKSLVTIGACATAGGIQALKNWGHRDEFLQCVYASPEYIDTLDTSTAISDHVAVDFELRGCPIERRQLVEVVRALLHGRRPRTPRHSVCLDCKRQGVVCVAVAQNMPCLGPVTQTGCGVLCPPFNRGCYGCFGPAAQANCESLSHQYLADRSRPAELVPLLRNFNANAPAFRDESDRVADLEGRP
jgi:coenzyme F420-reducing hydrogenase gamma subunit